MMIALVIAAAVAAIYLYGIVAYYYAFKNWVPFCGCKGAACGPRKTV